MQQQHSNWHFRKRPTGYPDLFDYIVLEPNPDAGKDCVSYDGTHLRICIVDSESIARMITMAPALVADLKLALCYMENPMSPGSRRHEDIARIRATIARAEG